MFKFAVVIFAVVACAAAKPVFIAAPVAYTVPAAPAPVVTATSSQYVARNHNGIAAAAVVAPLAAAYTAPVAAKYAAAYSHPLAYAAPVFAPAGPFAYAAAPAAYANAHLDAAYASSRVDVKQNYNAAFLPASYAVATAVPVASVAPIKYTAAPVLL